jgi:hypothetical protein
MRLGVCSESESMNEYKSRQTRELSDTTNAVNDQLSLVKAEASGEM